MRLRREGEVENLMKKWLRVKEVETVNWFKILNLAKIGGNDEKHHVEMKIAMKRRIKILKR